MTQPPFCLQKNGPYTVQCGPYFCSFFAESMSADVSLSGVKLVPSVIGKPRKLSSDVFLLQKLTNDHVGYA